jgi:hypothetical protein
LRCGTAAFCQASSCHTQRSLQCVKTGGKSTGAHIKDRPDTVTHTGSLWQRPYHSSVLKPAETAPDCQAVTHRASHTGQRPACTFLE